MKQLSIFRRLNALATLNKSDTELHDIFIKDAEWVKSQV